MQNNIRIEYTDTTGGEPNHAWATYFNLTVPDTLSNKTLMHIAKELCGLSGVRGKWYMDSDLFKFIPRGSNTILFIIIEAK